MNLFPHMMLAEITKNKELGNGFFQKLLYDDAIERYTYALKIGIAYLKQYTSNESLGIAELEKLLYEDGHIQKESDADVKHSYDPNDANTMSEFNKILRYYKKYTKNILQIAPEIINEFNITNVKEFLKGEIDYTNVKLETDENISKDVQTEMAKILYNIGLINYKKRNYLLTILYCKKSLEMYEIEQVKCKLCISYFKAGFFYEGCELSQTLKTKTKEVQDILNNFKNNELFTIFNSLNVNDLLEKNSNGFPIIDEAFLKYILTKFIKNEKVEARFLFAILFIGYNVLSPLDNIVYINNTENIFVFGDTHGQFTDTLNMITNLPGNSLNEKKGLIFDKENILIFNGDFVDRGCDSIGNYIFLLLLKIIYPQNVFLNRGNHEFQAINQQFGFATEVLKKYDFTYQTLYNAFQLTFSVLPIATILNDQIFIVHGGLPETFVSLDEIQEINRKVININNKALEGLMWSDPGEIETVAESKRNIGVVFGTSITDKFLTQNKLKIIIRSHEYIQNGYKSNHNGKIITIFSAPNYCGMIGKAAYLKFGDAGEYKISDELFYSIFYVS